MIPPHLDSTWGLLKRAFPDGILDADYFAVLEHLYPHMADGNIVIVVAEFTGREVGIVLNDVLGVGSGGRVDAEARASVGDRLRQAGFEEWVTEDA